jgi:hypothetical protein
VRVPGDSRIRARVTVDYSVSIAAAVALLDLIIFL